MSGQDLTVVDIDLRRDPEAVIEAASRAAKALQKVVEGKGNKVMVGGKQYLQFEDWQTLGQFYGYSVKTHSARPAEVDGVSGAEAEADLIELRTGLVVGGAQGYCMSNEENWIGKPWFQLASMAQTRAGAKALRNRLAWVAVLAGYEPTPAEEMTGNENGTTAKPKHFCEEHGITYRRFEKDGRVWYSHKTDDGWCNEGKARETQPAQPAKPNGQAQPPKAAPKAEPSKSGPGVTEDKWAKWDALASAAVQLGIWPAFVEDGEPIWEFGEDRRPLKVTMAEVTDLYGSLQSRVKQARQGIKELLAEFETLWGEAMRMQMEPAFLPKFKDPTTVQQAEETVKVLTEAIKTAKKAEKVPA